MRKGKRLLALALALTLGLAGCGEGARAEDGTAEPTAAGQTEAQAPTERQTEPPAQAQETEPPVIYNDDWIAESYAIDGTYDDDVGNTWNYSIHVPQLRDESAEAQRINQEIRANYQREIDLLQESLDTGTSLMAGQVAWESRWNGSLLSLMIVDRWHTGSDYYEVYHYDFDQKTALTGSQVLARFGVEEEAFLENLRRGAAQTFDQIYDAFSGGVGEYEKRFLPCARAWTLSNVPQSADDVAFCPEGDSQFTAYIAIGSIAGASWYYQPVPVALSENQSTDGGPGAELDRFRASVVDGGRGLAVTDCDTGKTYSVRGCYHTYTKLALWAAGRMYYLAAITDTGLVEVVDLSGGEAYGELCSSGPLAGITGAAEFCPGTRDDGIAEQDTLYAQNGQGGEWDLWTYVQTWKSGLNMSLDGTWNLETEDRSYTLELSQSGTCALHVGHAQGGVLTYSGTIEPLGMGDGGVICGCYLTGQDGEERVGTWAVVPGDTLTLRTLSGEDLLETAQALLFQKDWS